MARSLLTEHRTHLERPPVFSVTSDTAANASYPVSRTKSARDDQPSDSDSFGSLVDSNTAASS